MLMQRRPRGRRRVVDGRISRGCRRPAGGWARLATRARQSARDRRLRRPLRSSLPPRHRHRHRSRSSALLAPRRRRRRRRRPHTRAMPQHDEEGGMRASPASFLRTMWRPLLAEVVGTALLVLLGVASLLPVKGPVFLTHPALGFGFVVTALVLVLGPVSGAHLNTAVSLAALLARKLAPLPFVLYVLAQLLGAVLGFGALVAMLPSHALSLERGAHVAPGCTRPSPEVPLLGAVAVEALLTGTLVLVVAALWAQHDPARPDRTAPIVLGLTIAGLVYAGGEITGASLNPARSFGPALWQNFWKDHWVYWVGPLAGAALAVLLHRVLVPPAPQAKAPADKEPEELPLRDKHDH